MSQIRGVKGEAPLVKRDKTPNKTDNVLSGAGLAVFEVNPHEVTSMLSLKDATINLF